MTTFVTLGSYRNFALNEDVQDLRAPNPACCSDSGILCGDCASLLLQREGHIRCSGGRPLVGNAANLTRMGLPNEYLPPEKPRRPVGNAGRRRSDGLTQM